MNVWIYDDPPKPWRPKLMDGETGQWVGDKEMKAACWTCTKFIKPVSIGSGLNLAALCRDFCNYECLVLPLLPEELFEI